MRGDVGITFVVVVVAAVVTVVAVVAVAAVAVFLWYNLSKNVFQSWLYTLVNVTPLLELLKEVLACYVGLTLKFSRKNSH